MPASRPRFLSAFRPHLTGAVVLVALLPACGWAQSAPQPLPPVLLASPDAPLPDPVRLALAQAGVPLDAVSIGVWPASGGPARVAHQLRTVRQAASLMKLFTTGTALQKLGPAWAWRTETGLDGTLLPDGRLRGSVYLRGQGDPTLVVERLDGLLTRWRAAGLTAIEGDILMDRQAFDVPAHDPAAFDGQVLKPYNAGPDALLLAHRAVTVRVRPDAARPGWAQADLFPPLEGVSLAANLPLRDGPCGDWRQSLALTMAPSRGPVDLPPPIGGTAPSTWSVGLQGTYPAACGEREWPLLWPANDDHSARLLASRWRQAGGVLTGRVKDGVWPAGLPVWQAWTSPPLGEVVRDINKFSNNVMARQLFLALGSDTDGRARLSTARAAVGDWVRQATRDPGEPTGPCDGDALTLDNGSGLSRQERSSAACLGRWLQSVWMSPVMPEFVASLPVAGVDGTTRRLKGAQGAAHLKTGSLDGVAGIAGLVHGAHGERLVLVAIVNHPRADGARPAFDALLTWAQASAN